MPVSHAHFNSHWKRRNGCRPPIISDVMAGWNHGLRIFLVVMFCWLATGLAHAQPAPGGSNIVVGVLVDGYPLSFRGPDGRMQGFSYELVQEIEQVMGLHFDRVEMRSQAANAAFESGRVDLLDSYAYSPERTAWAEFSVPYLDLSGQIFVRKNESEIQSLADLKGRTVLVHRDSLGERVLQQAGLQASIVYVESVQQAMIMLDRGEGDATLAARLTGLSMAHHLGLKQVRVLPAKVPGYDVNKCIAVRKGNHVLLARINEGMALLVRTGKFDELYRKWFGFVAPPGYTKEQILLAVAIGLALALGISGWAVVRQRQLRKQIARQSESLRESSEQLRLAVQVANIGLWDWNIQTNRVVYSQAWKRLLGHEANEVGDDFSEWEQRLHPEDQAKTKTHLQHHLAKPQGALEMEFRLRHKDGSWRWIFFRGEVFLNAEGQAIRLLGCHLDITARRLLEEQFRQAQKMDAIGQLAGGIAHDFNNILAAMVMQIDFAIETENLPAEARENLEELRLATERAASLTRQLLAFSRRQVVQKQTLGLNQLVTSMAKLLHRVLGEPVRLTLQLPPAELFTHADPGMMDQVLLNLAVNSRDAMPDGGTLTIVTGKKDFSEAAAEAASLAAAGSYVYLEVRDTGTGIAPESRAHIFEPFFTTKAPGKGTGIGLATVFTIVKQHGGAIEVESEVGRGTLFRVFLPAMPAAESAAVGAAPVPAPAGGLETILLVEDEIQVRRLTRIMLERAGYRVLEAANGVEALQVWNTHAAQIKLLFTDMVMPEGVSGQNLARQVLAQNPRLPVIFTSGYSMELTEENFSLKSNQQFLTKPSSHQKILEAVRLCLAAEKHDSVAMGGD